MHTLIPMNKIQADIHVFDSEIVCHVQTEDPENHTLLFKGKYACQIREYHHC